MEGSKDRLGREKPSEEVALTKMRHGKSIRNRVREDQRDMTGKSSGAPLIMIQTDGHAEGTPQIILPVMTVILDLMDFHRWSKRGWSE